MRWLRSARLGAIVCALAVPVVAVSATPVAGVTPAARDVDATVSVLHAIPVGGGADIVDVYAGRTLLVDNLTPGKLRTVKVPAGIYDFAFFSNGGSPGTGLPVLSTPRTRVPSGANLTVTANLTAGGKAVSNVFTNDTTTVGNGKGRLTVRHIAEAPPVDVRTSTAVLLAGLSNGRQASTGLIAGNYPIDVVRAGTRKLLLAPAKVTIRNTPGTDDMGTNTIAYLWGDAASGSLKQAVQNVRIDLR